MTLAILFRGALAGILLVLVFVAVQLAVFVAVTYERGQGLVGWLTFFPDDTEGS